MKIVVASDSFKGCMTSEQVSNIMANAIHHVDENIIVDKFLIGDGGENTLEAILSVSEGHLEYVDVYDHYGHIVSASYGILEDGTAVIEISKAVGLNMYPREKRNAYYASSYGVGQMILHAYRNGCRKMIVTLGGCGVNDGGMGMLEALGMRFYDVNHKFLRGIAKNLSRIDFIDTRRLNKLKGLSIIVACDVDNYLLGKDGTTYTYGFQKGLFPKQIENIEKGMEHYVSMMKDRGYELDIFGGGSGGGISAILQSVYHAKMKSGIELLFDYNHIEDAIKECDLVLTGEGQSDKQTLYGKVPLGINKLAKKYNKPCIIISGALGRDYESLYEEGFLGIYSITDRIMNFQDAIKQAPKKLWNCTYSVIKTIVYFRKGE